MILRIRLLTLFPALLAMESLISPLQVRADEATVTVTNEHLLTVGNDQLGNVILKITSMLDKSVTVFVLEGLSLSPACGSHLSRCRTLTIESTAITNTTSKHTVFIPLENSVALLELTHNGINSALSISSQHTLSFSGISGNRNCSSLTVKQIGSRHYLPCVSDEGLYLCMLDVNTTDIEQSTVERCQRMLDISLIGYESLSDVILSADAMAPSFRQQLLFLLQSALYRYHPFTNLLSFVNDFSSLCSSVDQLLRSPKMNSELLLYCRARTSIVYNTDYDQIVSLGLLENVQYPCSPSAEFIIHLTQNQMELSYKTTGNANVTVKIFSSTTASDDFHSGACFTLGSDSLFAFTDRRTGVLVFNTTSESFTLLPGTKSCGAVGCELLLDYNDQYLVVRNRLQQRLAVYDILRRGQMIITLSNTTSRLVGLIHNIRVQNVPTTAPSTTSAETTASTTLPTITSSLLSTGAIIGIVVVIIISLLAVCGIIIVIVVLYMLNKRKKSGIFTPSTIEEHSAISKAEEAEESPHAHQDGKVKESTLTSIENATTGDDKESAINTVTPDGGQGDAETATPTLECAEVTDESQGRPEQGHTHSSDVLTDTSDHTDICDKSELDNESSKLSDGDESMAAKDPRNTSPTDEAQTRSKEEKTDSLYPLRTMLSTIKEDDH